MTAYCECDTHTGSERNADGERVCERCGKPDDDIAASYRTLDLILDPDNPRYEGFWA